MAAAYHATRWECRTEEVHLIPLLEGVARFVCAEERAEGISVSVVASEEGPTVPAESAAPLAVAAAEIFTDRVRRGKLGAGSGGTIKIDCARTGDGFLVAIEDGGAGGSSPEDEIGLKLAAALVEQAGGSVEFGDRIEILVPLSEPAADEVGLAG